MAANEPLQGAGMNSAEDKGPTDCGLSALLASLSVIDMLGPKAFDATSLEVRCTNAVADAMTLRENVTRLVKGPMSACQLLAAVHEKLTEQSRLLDERPRAESGFDRWIKELEKLVASIENKSMTYQQMGEAVVEVGDKMDLSDASFDATKLVLLRVRVSSLWVEGYILGLNLVTANCALVEMLLAVSVDLPQPARQGLTNLRDNLVAVAKAAGALEGIAAGLGFAAATAALVNPVALTAALAFAETCGWLEKLLLERGPNKRDVSKRLVCVEYHLERWKAKHYPWFKVAVDGFTDKANKFLRTTDDDPEPEAPRPPHS